MPEPKPSTVSVLCLNTYLIPALFVDKGNATCKNQSSRATAIGKLIAGSSGRTTSAKRSPTISPLPEHLSSTSPSTQRAPSDSTTGGKALRRSPQVTSLAVTNGGSAPYDVVAMQEVWGSSMSEIETPIKHAYNVLPYCRSWGFSVLDTALQYANKRGGLWMAGKKESTRILYTKWMSYGMSSTRSKKGAVATLYLLHQSEGQNKEKKEEGYNREGVQRGFRKGREKRAPSTDSLDTGGSTSENASSENYSEGGCDDDDDHIGGLKYLLVVNTHVDPTNDDRMIERQLDQLQRWLATTVVQDKNFLNKIEGGGGANNNKEDRYTTLAHSVGFLLVGDWNSSSKFVRQFMTLLPEMTDLYDDCWARLKNPSIFTTTAANKKIYPSISSRGQQQLDRRFDATYDGAKNSLAMWKSERERVDIQFGVNTLVLPNSSAQVKFAPMEATDAEILHYPPGAELSDHYPVRLTLKKRI